MLHLTVFFWYCNCKLFKSGTLNNISIAQRATITGIVLQHASWGRCANIEADAVPLDTSPKTANMTMKQLIFRLKNYTVPLHSEKNKHLFLK